MFYPTKKILHMLHRKITTSVILIVIISLSGNFATGKNDILFKIYLFKVIKNGLFYIFDFSKYLKNRLYDICILISEITYL